MYSRYSYHLATYYRPMHKIITNETLYFCTTVWLGTVSISPATHMVSVCRGDELEFICTTTEIRLRWIVSVASTPHTFIFNMESSTSWPFNLTTELLPMLQSMLPMVGSLLFNPTSAELNGTQVTCVGRDKNSATACIRDSANFNHGHGWRSC